MGKKKKSVYLETSIVSYYVARPSRDIVILAHQQLTRDWWASADKHFRIFISDIVIQEATKGDPFAARKRLEVLQDFPLLESNHQVRDIARLYLEKLAFPQESYLDAAHLAIVTTYKVDYLLTWNCRHLANGEIIKKLARLNQETGLYTPAICTPAELLEVM